MIEIDNYFVLKTYLILKITLFIIKIYVNLSQRLYKIYEKTKIMKGIQKALEILGG